MEGGRPRPPERKTERLALNCGFQDKTRRTSKREEDPEMEVSNASSQEILDQMLRDGKVSEDDYLRLSRAMSGVSNPPATPDIPFPVNSKLHKSMEEGVIGGLCAGYAQYFGVDKYIVRMILVLVFFLLTLLHGFGLALVPLYFVHCVFLPWDNEEKARPLVEGKRLRSFTVAVACLFFLCPWLFSELGLLKLVKLYRNEEIPVLTQQFLQGTFAGRAIGCASVYGYAIGGDLKCQILCPDILSFEIDRLLLSFLAIAFATFFTLLLRLIYANLCNGKLRNYYADTVLSLGTAWILFLLVGSFSPLLTLWK
jgi:phage shock protein PspC (stress-responsive transcriptional regulator)